MIDHLAQGESMLQVLVEKDIAHEGNNHRVQKESDLEVHMVGDPNHLLDLTMIGGLAVEVLLHIG